VPVNPDRLRRWLVRLVLFATIVVALLFVRRYGLWTVPAGLDTMLPEVSPGAVCIVDERVGEVRPGDIVWFTLADGSVLLSRVAALRDGAFLVAHDHAGSRFAALQGEALGPIPVASVRHRVLVVLREPDLPAGADGR
jgi:hypothetical protein